MKKKSPRIDRNQTPTVSIGMPVYNGEQWLHTAIKSILQQSYSDFELIISDNASTDKTQEICEQYARQDERVRYIRNEKNLGANPNFNKVFFESRGRYFKWASCNDLLHVDMLQRCVGELDKNGDAVLCFPNTKLFMDIDGEYQEYEDPASITSEKAHQRFRDLIEQLGLNNMLNGLFRSDALAKTKLIKTYFSSDNVLMAELTLHGKMINVPEFLFYRRMEPQSATALKDYDELVKHYRPDSSMKMIFQEWIIQFHYMKAAFGAPILKSKIKCVTFVLKNMLWHRKELWQDFKFSFIELERMTKKNILRLVTVTEFTNHGH